MTAEVCEERYQRPTGQTYACTGMRDHGGKHSWDWLQRVDEGPTSSVALLSAGLIRSIQAGVYDPYLEAILGAAHERKRTLRGVRTFTDLVRGE